MRCEVTRSRGGDVVVICRGGKRKNPPCYRDNAPASVQCDFITGYRDTGVARMPITCDRWCCDNGACSVQVGPNKHNCRMHFDEVGRARKAVQFVPEVLPESKT